MRYSAFEQAAAEAASGMKEIETQIEQLMAQMDQLKGKRDLLDNLAQQLAGLQPTTPVAQSIAQSVTQPTAQSMPAAVPSSSPKVAPIEMPAPRPARASSPDVEAEMAAASARSLRDEWTGRSSSDSGIKGPSDSTIRGRL